MTTATLMRPVAAAIDLQFSTAAEMHEGLDSAVATLIGPAKEAGCGILVTRVHPGHYTVAVDQSVPFGETYETIAA